MNDDFLYKFRKPPPQEFAADLYQRISKPMKTTSRTRALRTVALAFALVAVISAVLFFSPATHALADNIIHQIGGYLFVQATPQAGPVNNEITKQKAADSPEQEAADNPKQKAADSPEQKATEVAYKQELEDHIKNVGPDNDDAALGTAPDADAASQLAGFTVITPAYVPDGYTVSTENSSGIWRFSQRFGGMAALITYTNQATQGFLTIEELQYQEDQPRTVERPEINDVTVRGQSGVWMPALDDKSALVWEENGIMYSVVVNADTLPLDEILKVAEALGK